MRPQGVVIYLRKDFFILSFFVLYILPFGLVSLRTFRLVHGLISAWVSWVQEFTRAQGGCDNQRCHNKKTPDRK